VDQEAIAPSFDSLAGEVCLAAAALTPGAGTAEFRLVHSSLLLREYWWMPHSPVVSVVYASPGWQTKFTAAMQGKNFIRIRIKGSIASQARARVEAFTIVKVPAPPLPFIPIPYPNVSASTFLAAMPTLLNLVLQALTFHGYSTLSAGYDAKGSGVSDDQLIFELR
jgi:hypothetical protein